MAVQIPSVIQFLEAFAPLETAENWDNVGLLVGDSNGPLQKVMTCLTLTPDVAEEAIAKGVGLIVSHHPVMFRSLQKLTDQSSETRMLLQLIRSGVGVYSPHTAFDNSARGINQGLAERLELEEIQPLRPFERPSSQSSKSAGPSEAPAQGSGRWGKLQQPVSWPAFVQWVQNRLGAQNLQVAGTPERPVERVALACGSAAEYLKDALRLGCDAFITGEARFHALLDARASGIGLVLLGHYGSERCGVEQLAEELHRAFPDLQVWASTAETDPLQWITA